MKKIIRDECVQINCTEKAVSEDTLPVKENSDVKSRFDRIEKEYKDVLEVLKNA